MDSFHA